METAKKQTFRCTKCGEFFSLIPPQNLDQYSLQKWAEDNRLCDECAELNRPTSISQGVDTSWDAGRWDPSKHDEGKIGLGEDSAEIEQKR